MVAGRIGIGVASSRRVEGAGGGGIDAVFFEGGVAAAGGVGEVTAAGFGTVESISAATAPATATVAASTSLIWPEGFFGSIAGWSGAAGFSGGFSKERIFGSSFGASSGGFSKERIFSSGLASSTDVGGTAVSLTGAAGGTRGDRSSPVRAFTGGSSGGAEVGTVDVERRRAGSGPDSFCAGARGGAASALVLVFGFG